ncbi:MAG: hypothetical protein J6Y71_03765 [Ruminococcus sp.]|nr:hypothetical protein [Ruminococcus sp.]
MMSFDEENTMICEQGMEAEANKNIDKAIELYESLLERRFDGTHPYRSLCEIYHKQKRFKDEIRVIKALKKVTPSWRYKEADKYRWYDKRLAELSKR